MIGDAAFVGDTLFMPDGGTARADFPGGDARELYRSIRRVLALPAETRLFMCHDYRRRTGATFAGRPPSPRSARTISMSTTASARTSSSPCARRATRRSACRRSDLPSIQVNMPRPAEMPEPEDNGKVYLRGAARSALIVRRRTEFGNRLVGKPLYVLECCRHMRERIV